MSKFFLELNILKINKVFLFILVNLLIIFYSTNLYAEDIRIGIEPEKYFTTIRMQSISGKWQIHLTKRVATEAYTVTEEIHTNEDFVLIFIPKGIIFKSPDSYIDDGFDKVLISGGNIISLELPQLPPKVLQGSFEITHDKSQLYITNTISLDNYIISCSSTELFSSEEESIKAGIIAVATKANYLLKNSNHPESDFTVCDTEHCIRYLGKGGNRDLVELLYSSVSNLLLYYNNKLIFPRYHHTCGGKTSSAADVFGLINEPYHISLSDLKDNKGSENCFHSPSFHWSMELPISSIADFLSLEYAGGADGIYERYEPIKINSEGRILMFRIIGSKIKDVHALDFLEHFQNFYGNNSIKSLRLTFEPLRRSLVIKGMGEGDGVGMCLYGSDGLAKKGSNYKQILNFYYPGTTIK